MSNVEITIFFAIGVGLLIFGGRILFSDQALEKMYKSGYWKKDSVWFSEKEGRQFDRLYRGGHFPTRTNHSGRHYYHVVNCVINHNVELVGNGVRNLFV